MGVFFLLCWFKSDRAHQIEPVTLSFVLYKNAQHGGTYIRRSAAT